MRGYHFYNNILVYSGLMLGAISIYFKYSLGIVIVAFLLLSLLIFRGVTALVTGKISASNKHGHFEVEGKEAKKIGKFLIIVLTSVLICLLLIVILGWDDIQQFNRL